MDITNRGITRRSTLGLIGATAVGVAVGESLVSAASAAPGTPITAEPGAPQVSLTLNGAPAAVGDYVFPSEVDTLVLDNGLARFTFGRDDAAGGVVTGWTNTSITVTSIIVNGTELAHNLNGVDPRDPDRQHSFYIDAGGGSSRLVCTLVRVLRVTDDLVEVAFVDNTSRPLQHEHHLIMRAGKQGLYGYNILHAVTATSISEVRMNARWDRSIFNYCYNWEHGSGQQPTYAYLATQTSVGDETWRIDGINNPNLPSPDDNAANLPPNSVYSKYNWSLYHHENPMFGHYGHGFGAWLTPLGGVTGDTLTAFYGVGPNHQDLAIHQDALILNYFGANHYGLPSYSLASGYTRLYGPWFTYVTTGDTPEQVIASASAIAHAEIADNREGSDWIVDPLYPTPAQRSTVTGKLQLADGRPADGFYVLLSTQTVTDVYTIHEPTYWVKTDPDGSFRLPGIPPAWQIGGTAAGSYTLYIFAGKGSVVDQYRQTGVTVSGTTTDLGTITWAPTNRSTHLWQIGKADRSGGEFALASLSSVVPAPRSYEKPTQVPGNLTFTVGQSWEPTDWYYAQTNGGTWTTSFTLDRAYTGTAYLTVSTSLQSGSRPTVAINGSSSGITGSLPSNNDSTIGRQADRSGYPRLAVLSFPASRLVAGANTITLTRGNGAAGGNGLGWDTLLLEVDETTAPEPAQLTGSAQLLSRVSHQGTWRLTVNNTGTGTANDVRLSGVAWPPGSTVIGLPAIGDRDPNKFPVPIIGSIPAGGSATIDVSIDGSAFANGLGDGVVATVLANGGRAGTTIPIAARLGAGLTATSSPTDWGTGATVLISVDGGIVPVIGTVTLAEGDTMLGSAGLTSNSVEITLPAGLAAGTHTLTVSYSGSEFLDPAQTTVTVTVNLPAAWSASTVYNAGDTVSYNGTPYLASWYTQNQAPGDPNGPWQELALTLDGQVIWTASRIFNAGAVVVLDGKTYKAGWYARNQRPGDPNGPWQEQAPAGPNGSPAAWTPTTIYTAGDQVSYSGHTYQAQWWTRNQTPGDSGGPWTLLN